jgi:hypothetical protein
MMSWNGPIVALGEPGVTVTEDDVLALPFVFELSPELVAELEF